MYSVAFVMFVMIGIALTNLFLGFAAAILVGRGPRHWTDIDRAVQVRYVMLRWPRWRRARSEPVADTAADTSGPATSPTRLPSPVVAAPSQVTRSLPSRSPFDSVSVPAADPGDRMGDEDSPGPGPWAPAVGSAKASLSDLPPQEYLARQLETWRDECEPDAPASLSGVSIDAAATVLDDVLRESLMSAVLERLTGQLRRDRRVVRIAADRLAWLSPDVDPEDAVMPLDRIRQLLTATRFTSGPRTIPLRVSAAVVAVQVDDNGPALLSRLEQSLQFAAQRCEPPLARDLGDGPEAAEAWELELDESVYALTD